jgi:hypothetical protein
MPARPEILLKTDKATVVLELGRDGKFVVRTSSWEDNRTILAGERLQIENLEAFIAFHSSSRGITAENTSQKRSRIPASEHATRKG